MRVLKQGVCGPDVALVRARLGLPPVREQGIRQYRFDQDLEIAVEQFQLSHDLPITGVVDETTYHKIME